MKKHILTFIFCGSLLLPFADLYAHGDPGTVLFALGLRKALETFAKKFELATAAGKTLTVYYQNGVDSETDILYIEQNGKYSKMVSFYGTVYKSSLYDLIIPFPACESGAEREKRRAVVFASGKTGKSE